MKSRQANMNVIRRGEVPAASTNRWQQTHANGSAGEDAAARHLIALGYTILERNYRHKRSEIDLIVKVGKYMVFVEVKTRLSSRHGFPKTFVSEKKHRIILRGAAHYICTINWEGPIRFDIVAVMLNNRRVVEVRQFEDAFW